MDQRIRYWYLLQSTCAKSFIKEAKFSYIVSGSCFIRFLLKTFIHHQTLFVYPATALWRLLTNPVGGNRKHYQRTWIKKSIETVFSIAICCQCGDKWQSKTLFLTPFDLRSSIVLTFSIAAYPVWLSYVQAHLSLNWWPIR